MHRDNDIAIFHFGPKNKHNLNYLTRKTVFYRSQGGRPSCFTSYRFREISVNFMLCASFFSKTTSLNDEKT